MPPDAPAADSADAGPLDVVGVGSALVDVLAHGDDPQLERLGLKKGTMALVDLAEAARLYGAMGPGIEVSGGSAANTVAGVAALGGRAGYVCKVADDELGEVFRHDLTSLGVVLGANAAVPADPAADRATGRCLVFVTPDGERTMATHLGVASTLGPGDLDGGMLGRAQVVYLEGYLWDLEPAKQALRDAVGHAHDADGLVALSMSDPLCVERHRREFLTLLHGEVDVLFANEEEAVSLFSAASLDQALDALEETGILAAVTRGALGSVVVGAHGRLEVPAVPVEAVVDTTGAGDLYAAGFLHGLTQGAGPEDCARLGGLCAGEVISHLGARPEQDLRLLAAAAGLR